MTTAPAMTGLGRCFFPFLSYRPNLGLNNYTMTKEQLCQEYCLTEKQFFGEEKYDGPLSLSGLKSIPAGFNPTVGGSLYLRGLKSIPAGFNPTVGGWLELSGLKSIPAGFNPTVGGWLDLSGLKSIPAGFNPTVGGALNLRGLKSTERSAVKVNPYTSRLLQGMDVNAPHPLR